MKIVAFLAAGALAAAFAVPAAAQTPPPSVPQMDCGSAPYLPGEKMMEDPSTRRRFERELKMYGECVKKYVADRQGAIKELQVQEKAHMEAANKAVNDYNALMKSFNDTQK